MTFGLRAQFSEFGPGSASESSDLDEIRRHRRHLMRRSRILRSAAGRAGLGQASNFGSAVSNCAGGTEICRCGRLSGAAAPDFGPSLLPEAFQLAPPRSARPAPAKVRPNVVS